MKRITKTIDKALISGLPQNRLGDRIYTLVHFLRVHRRLPTQMNRFNDYLYRLKTTDEILNPLRVFVSDKEYVKLFVKAVVGDQFNVPTIDVLRSADAVRGYSFPPDCCIKPTHLSGDVVLRRQGGALDVEKVVAWFDMNFYRVNREANYRSLAPKVIVEPLIFDSADLEDFKIFCYMGRPKLIQVDVARHIEHTRKLFDVAWNELPFTLGYPRAQCEIERPANLEQMLQVAGELSRYFTFVRVDLYSNGTECLVGEITNCPGNISETFIPLSGEDAVSSLIFS